ncbi:hypothetical protein DWB77_00452 [Streptomyces hundungensis]|uniref:Uncharacterized protein n=1 Tax=Streptomyces hundungensis TaxID=1077946 RepID=A0A387H3S2_9ACTN|nr:hypothetical protein DWB77_00452 [Streptomyces hundungensis]
MNRSPPGRPRRPHRPRRPQSRRRTRPPPSGGGEAGPHARHRRHGPYRPRLAPAGVCATTRPRPLESCFGGHCWKPLRRQDGPGRQVICGDTQSCCAPDGGIEKFLEESAAAKKLIKKGEDVLKGLQGNTSSCVNGQGLGVIALRPVCDHPRPRSAWGHRGWDRGGRVAGPRPNVGAHRELRGSAGFGSRASVSGPSGAWVCGNSTHMMNSRLAAVNSHPTELPAWGQVAFVVVFLVAAVFVVTGLIRRRRK